MGPEVLGDYAIESELGRGAMGVVFRARHRPTGASRALKVLDSVDPELVARFRREAEALARVGGDGVVPVHEVGVAQRRLFFAMDVMPGGSLRARLGRGPLGLEPAVRLGARLARALDRCHRAGLVHRDVKPDNVLFDEEDRPRLADFGLARDVRASTLTASGTVVGTPAYMAPEQLAGLKVDGRADIYAVATIVVEALTGEPPYAGKSLVETFEAKRSGARKPLPPGLPPALAFALERALSVDPAARQESAAAFADDLEAALAAAPARSRRRGLLAALVALVALVALAGLAATARPGRGREAAESKDRDLSVRPERPREAGESKDAATASRELELAARALRTHDAPERAAAHVERARAAMRGAALPADAVARVVSACAERIDADARQTNPLAEASLVERRFTEIERVIALARDLGGTFRLPAEIADVAAVAGDHRKSHGPEWPGVFEAGLVALEANPNLAVEISLWCVEWVKRVHGPAVAVKPMLARAVAVAPPSVRPRVIVQELDFLRFSGAIEDMLRRAAAELATYRADDEAVADILDTVVNVPMAHPIAGPLVDAVVDAAPGWPDALVVRARLDPARREDALVALEKGLRRVDHAKAIDALAAEPARVRERARRLVVAGRASDAAALLARSDDPALRALVDAARDATTAAKRDALARRLAP